MAISCISDLTSDNLSYLQYYRKLESGKIIYNDDNTVIVYDETEKRLYLKSNDIDIVDKYIFDFSFYDSIVVYNEKIAKLIKDRYELEETYSFYLYAYLSRDKIKLDDYDFRLIDMPYYDFIRANYHYSSDDELKEIITSKHLFGLFDNGEMAGFIGIHTDGSMGLLLVFEKFRGKHYGYILEAMLINYLLDNGELPYCDVMDDNYYSMHIQDKLKMTRSAGKKYWLFKNE